MYTITCFWNAEAEVADDRFRYAVIPARLNGKWVFVRQKAKETFELPAGRREPGETILETARRELHEETGATQFTLEPIATFMVTSSDKPAAPDAPCGMLYLADIQTAGPVPPDSEIGETSLADELPEHLSYPDVQPRLFRLASSYLDYKIRCSGGPEPRTGQEAAGLC